MDRGLNRYLRKRGVSRGEIERAERDGLLTLLVLDQLLVPGVPHLDADAVSARSGVEIETATRLWRALGFPDTRAGQAVFTEESVEVLRLLNTRQRGSIFTDDDPADLVAQVRAIGAGLARVAESLSDQIAEVVSAARDAGMDDATVAAAIVEGLDWPLLARLTDYALRVQVRAAVRRKLLIPPLESGEVPAVVIGFVDLVGYTAISQELDGRELAALVARFETVTYDTVAQLGARLVKTIGDEVMFVTEDPELGLRVALALTERTGEDDVLPRARAGVSFGPALAREGDYYGSVVNLAHRLVELGRPSSVIVGADLASALAANPDFAFQRLRSRRLRGIGRVEIYAATAVVRTKDSGTGTAENG